MKVGRHTEATNPIQLIKLTLNQAHKGHTHTHARTRSESTCAEQETH